MGAAVIVCLCEGVNEARIRDAVESGADTVRQVGRSCGAGEGCGMCRHDIREIIRSRRIRQEQDEAPLSK